MPIAADDPIVTDAIEQFLAAARPKILALVEEHQQVNDELRLQEEEMSTTRIKSTNLWLQAKKLADSLSELDVEDEEIDKAMAKLETAEKIPRQYQPSTRY